MKNYLVLGTIGISLAVACKTNKPASESANNTINFNEQLMAVNKRFPDASTEELKAGYEIYTGSCTRCHGQKDVTIYTEEKLFQIVDVMSQKAKLTTKEKTALTRFAIAYRATASKK